MALPTKLLYVDYAIMNDGPRGLFHDLLYAKYYVLGFTSNEFDGAIQRVHTQRREQDIGESSINSLHDGSLDIWRPGQKP